jgi:NAD(P)-dependent dehydrogenase (short-subunit alcohol dehydrogenase family)
MERALRLGADYVATGHYVRLKYKAGVYGPMGCIENIDWVEWVNAININLLGSVLMCKYLVPVFKGQKNGKIIQISGGGATKPIPYISAYAASKAGIVRFAETLAHEVFEFGIKVNSIAPGPLNTGMLEEVLSAGPDKVGESFYQQSIKQLHSGGAPLNLAADLAVFLASESGDAPKRQVALLTDRIRFNEDRPQIYGTVFDWNEKLSAIDFAHMEAIRDDKDFEKK